MTANDYKAAPYWKYRTGYGTHHGDHWRNVIIPAQERKSGHPLFYGWSKGDRLTEDQTSWIAAYWSGLVAESERNYDVWRTLKQNQAAKSRLAAAWSRVWIKEEREWDKEKKVSKPTDIWRSGSDDAPGVSRGIVPANGKSGGHKYEDTIRPQIGVITARPKSEVIATIAERLGLTIEAATEKFEKELRQQSRNLFKHHGKGVWSTVHPECLKITAAELKALQSLASAAKRQAKSRTEHQELWWSMLSELPHCEPDYANPQNCPRWRHVEAEPARLAALQAIQACAKSDEKREMSPWDYLSYLCENVRNFIRDEKQVPFCSDGRFRQGKNYYPREVFRNAKKMDRSEFADHTLACGHSVEYLAQAIDLAAKRGDVVIEGEHITGAATVENERKAKEENERKQRVTQAKLRLIGRLRSELGDSWVWRGCYITEAIEQFTQDSEGRFTLINMDEVLGPYPESQITQDNAYSILEVVKELGLLA